MSTLRKHHSNKATMIADFNNAIKNNQILKALKIAESILSSHQNYPVSLADYISKTLSLHGLPQAEHEQSAQRVPVDAFPPNGSDAEVSGLDTEVLNSTYLYSPDFLRSKYKHIRSLDDETLMRHFIIHSSKEILDPSAYFDTSYYLETLKELGSQLIHNNPLVDYIIKTREPSRHKGYPPGHPNPFFLNVKNKDFIQGGSKSIKTPLEFFLEDNDTSEDFSPIFSSSLYRLANPDVAVARVNPLRHYMSTRHVEHRSTFYRPNYSYIGSASILKGDLASEFHDFDVIIITLFVAGEELSDLQLKTLRSYRDSGYYVVCVLNLKNTDLTNELNLDSISADILIARANIGFDFGAWRTAAWMLPMLSQAKTLTFTNDSLFIVSIDDLRNLRKDVGKYRAITFLSMNTQIKPHPQSYFIACPNILLTDFTSNFIANAAYYSAKTQCIHEAEVQLLEELEKASIPYRVAFNTQISQDINANPTIHEWEELIRQGFPFLKVTLFTEGLRSPHEASFSSVLCEESKWLIANHISSRTSHDYKQKTERLDPFYYVSTDLQERAFNEYGARQALNPTHQAWPTIYLPPLKNSPRTTKRIIAVIHCYYVDIAKDLICRVTECGAAQRIICTVDTTSKQEELHSYLSSLGVDFKIRICENRGRDVAPFLIDCREDIIDSDIVLHLHTKKSPHDSNRYAGWLDWLTNNLIKSPEHVSSIIRLLSVDSGIGMLYSEHYPGVRDLRNWGFNYSKAWRLLFKLGINITPNNLLEFPTSTMFWARSTVLTKLLSLDFAYDDFDPEEGQVDGTLAHAIERSMLYICESEGLLGLPISTFNKNGALCDPYNDPKLSSRYASLLCRPCDVGSSKLLFSRSRCNKPRLNILLPTFNSDKIYGGISTALKVFDSLIDGFDQSIDVRIVITSEATRYQSLANELPGRYPSFMYVNPQDSDVSKCITDLSITPHAILPVRSNDIFLATAWWTAELAKEIQKAQVTIHRKFHKYIYLIQDYESGFYGWSQQKARADSTYKSFNDFSAVINSEELFSFMKQRFTLPGARCLPFSLNATLRENISKTNKENIIIAYARPGTPRNLFEVIIETLRLFQEKRFDLAEEYQIILAGEIFDEGLISNLSNCSNYGKLTLKEYADTLSKAKIGLSLMMSPHPSYPPLEMAYAGCKVITNKYESKDLSVRSPNILSVESFSADVLSDNLISLAEDSLRDFTPEFAQLVNPVIENISYFDPKIFAQQNFDILSENV